jgi:hypothetical protein
MTAAELVSKLMAIEREVDCLERSRLKEMLGKVEDGLLEIEWQVNVLTRENQTLHLRLDAIRQGNKPWPKIRRWKASAVSLKRLGAGPSREPVRAHAGIGELPRAWNLRRLFNRGSRAEEHLPDQA